MTSGQRMLEIDSAEKRYGRRMALHIDHFALTEGDRVLLKITRSPAMRQLKIGYLPQSGGMYGDMTLRENLEIFCRLFNVTWNESRVNGMHFTDALQPVWDLPVAQLSGGTQKLAGLACILAIEPDALLLDEPASDLDPEHAKEFYILLAGLCQTLKFVVVSTHDTRGLDFFHRTLVLKDGRPS
jgi:ABC-2 type transport system ATP-binding protein